MKKIYTLIILLCALSAKSQVVINEVYGGGGNAGSTYKNDFIELYNNSAVAVNLTGWSVQYASTAGTTWAVTILSGSIPANGHYLVQEAQGAGGTTNLPTPDATGTIAMAAGAGKVILCNVTTAQTGANPTGAQIIDKVGFGAGTNGFEGTGPTATLTNTTSAQRTPEGFDSNNNATDFTTGLPSPANASGGADVTPPTVSALSPANNSVNVATSFSASITFSETIQKGAAGTITIKKVSDNNIVQTINITNATVVVSGSSVSFDVNSLAFNTAYYVEISSGAFKDLSNNNFAGISGNATWQFTTSATPPAGTLGTTYSFNTCSSSLPDGFMQYDVLGDQKWGCTTFGRDPANLPLGSAANGVQINGFLVTNIPNEDWLITPSFNLTGTSFPLLSFWSRTAFNGVPLQLKISTNYPGTGDPRNYTWTDLNGRFPDQTSDAWTLSSNINLSAFKQSSVFVAFVYNSSSDDGARWTLDDITINNSPTPPPPTLTVSTTDMQYTFVASGSTGDKNFTFIGNDLTANVTLTSTGAFLLSKDGTAFSSSITYTVAEANNISKSVFVRFAPTQPNQNYTGTVTVATSALSSTINLTGSSIDPATTLEVVNWNMEWFGDTDPTLGPTNDDLQQQNAETVLKTIGADIFGLVEVVDEARLATIVSHMPGYSYIICNYGSHVNPPDPSGGPLSGAQKEAFVYKTSMFSNIKTRPLINNTNVASTSYNNWSSGRYPFLMTADVTLNCVTKKINFVLIHAKANTSPTATSYARRQAGATELHDTLQTYFPNDNVIILGDFNDDLDQSITSGFTTTSYSSFTTDPANFFSPTLALSLAGKKSTVSFNDVIDHVMLSNEMQPFYMPASANILTDVASLIPNYGKTTTDHYPVFTRYQFKNTTPPVITQCPTVTPFCAVANNTYTIPALTATDDCGITNFSYTITGATQRSGTTNNASGIFNVGTSTISWTVTDDFANTATCQTTVVVNANPTVSVTSITKCANDPAVNIIATPLPAGSYNYVWTIPAGATAPGNVANFSAVIAGTYTATITNQASGCTASGSGTLIVNANPTVTVSLATKCSSDAAVTISATPVPAGTYNYLWTVPAGATNPGNVAGFSATVAGTYNVSITNSTTGCTASASGTLTVNPSPTVTIPDAFAMSQGVVANTVYTGYNPASSLTLTSNASGGTGAYTYSWSNGATVSSTTVSPAFNTIYNLVVTDAIGCKATATKSIAVNNVGGANNPNNVVICHHPNGEMSSLEVEPNTVAVHLAHGDNLGRCNSATLTLTLAVSAFPNPSSNYFVITIQGASPYQPVNIRVVNTMGKVIEQRNNIYTKSFRLGSSYVSGIYLVQVVQGANKASVKVVKPGM